MILAHIHIRFTHFHRAQSRVVTVLKFMLFALLLWPVEAVFWLIFFAAAALIDAIIWIVKWVVVDLILRR